MNEVFQKIITRVSELKAEQAATIEAATAGRDAAQTAAEKAAADMTACMKANDADGYTAAKEAMHKQHDRIEAYTATLQAYTAPARCLCSAEESAQTMATIKAEYEKNLATYNNRVIEILAELEQLNAAALVNLRETLEAAERWCADIDTSKRAPWYEITSTQNMVFRLLGSTSVREELGLSPYADPRSMN